MNNYLIELKGIGFSYHTLHGETRALDNISFGVKEGEFLAIVGPSGCGKSTLLSIIAGLLKPEEGTIVVNNADGSIHYPKVGYMLQHDHLLDWRSVFQNVILGLEIHHDLTPENIAYVNLLLEEYGLGAFKDKRPGELSGGMKQRAALIRTMALKPELLLLDEAFSALDYQTRLIVSADICELIRKTGKTVIMITHDLSEAVRLSDRVIVLGSRPATIKKEIPIHLTITEHSPLAAMNAPEFNDYFNLLWKELNDENTSKT
ncbi:MAG: ABC transporter ATP-binding protein [Lachnospiraceae bacterium]|nr:ABC transporter ATP-binding protein [Lachnospiraceae bacterium]